MILCFGPGSQRVSRSSKKVPWESSWLTPRLKALVLKPEQDKAKGGQICIPILDVGDLKLREAR